jgi:hypothetical protein
MKVQIRFLAISAGAAILAACGGGGGGGEAPPAAPPPAGPAQAEITEQNAPTITAGAAITVADTAQVAGVGGTGLFLSASVTPTGGRIVGAGETVLKLVRLHGARTQLSRTLVVVGPFTEPCLVSGSITFSADLQSETTLSPGDSITADFSNCDDGDGAVLNGGFDFTFVSFSQSILDCFVFNACTGQDQVTVDLGFRNFQITAGTETLSVDGDTRLALDTTSLPLGTTTISGDSLTLSDGTSSDSLSAYSTTLTFDLSTGAYTIDSNGTLEIPSLFSGSVIFATTDPLMGFGTVEPDSGSVLIEGADSATITLVVLNNVQVQLDIDLDGDGITDEIQNTTWDELGALL